MSNSQFCIQQRQREQRQLKKLLILGFASSTILHGILAYAFPRWSFKSSQTVQEPIEITIVERPKPKPEPVKAETPPPVVKPPEPIKAETPPPAVKPPEPVKTETPPPVVKPPEPVKAETPPPAVKPPEPTPKKVLTSSTSASSQPIVPAPVENAAPPASVTATENSQSQDAPVAIDSAPAPPEVSSETAIEINCINNCEPKYPSTLEGAEGSAGVKLTIDRHGDVIGAELVIADSNSKINRQALLAARQMQFSSPGESAASVQVKIDFTVEGSEYDFARRREQERREQIKQETARQEKLERERQAQQEKLERERQVLQQQQQQQEPTSPPIPEAKPSPDPLPTLDPEKLDEERLRKFRERMDSYRQE